MKHFFAVTNLTRTHFLPALLGLGLVLSLASPAAADVQVNTVGGSIIAVHFDQVVQVASATVTDNYTVFGKGTTNVAINVTNAVLLSDEQTVALYLDSPTGEFFAVGVSNVLDFASSNITTTATGFINYFISTSLGTAADPSTAGEVISILGDTFQVTASGSDIGGTNDHGQFVYQNVFGNFEMSAQLTRLDFTDPDAKACLMARESLAPGSRSIEICVSPVVPGIGTSQIQMLVRTSSNGVAQAFSQPLQLGALPWFRMTRTNNSFAVYYGTNGSSWTQCGAFTNGFSGILSAGLAVTSHTNGHPTTAGVTSFGIAGARPGENVVPTLSAAIFNQTNLVVKWQRTPFDFSVQVCTNLVGTTNTSSENFTNATQWAFVLIPVFDTSLTGTNDAMPTPGRYMVLPLNLFSDRQMFVRLARVDRLIPDPVGVTPGIILSQASKSLVTTAAGANNICGNPIDTTTALAQSSVPVICPLGKTYQFTTAPSGATLKTCLLVRNFPVAGTTSCDGSYSAGSFKSQVTLTPTVPNTGYTFVAAATPAVKPSGCNPVKVQVNIK